MCTRFCLEDVCVLTESVPLFDQSDGIIHFPTLTLDRSGVIILYLIKIDEKQT